MKMFLLSDDLDILLGMRIVGVKGRYVESVRDFSDAFSEIVQDKEIGILVITLSLSNECEDIISPFKMNEQPLIVLLD